VNNAKTALITGASWGLGYELSKQFAKNGHNLILVARNAERLAEVAAELSTAYGVQVKTVAKNLAQGGAATELHQQLKADGVVVDFLVNNAGFGTYGRFADLPLAKELEEIQLNAATPVEMTRVFLPDMIARGDGHIINMASMAGFVPGPYMTIYFATKAFLVSFTESMSAELKGSGVKISAICPNVVATRFQETALNKASYIGGRFQPLMSSAEATMAMAYAEIKTGKVIIIPGLSNKIAVAFLRLIPRRFLRFAVILFMRGPDIPKYGTH